MVLLLHELPTERDWRRGIAPECAVHLLRWLVERRVSVADPQTSKLRRIALLTSVRVDARSTESIQAIPEAAYQRPKMFDIFFARTRQSMCSKQIHPISVSHDLATRKVRFSSLQSCDLTSQPIHDHECVGRSGEAICEG